jgi:hypothetical protein
MGLCVLWFTGLKRDESVTMEGGEPERDGRYVDDAVVLYSNPDFPERSYGAECGVPLAYAEHGRGGGWSYTGYSQWRERLAELAGYPAVNRSNDSWPHSQKAWEAVEGPFWELINFSDCEGTIGPLVAAKLASDFDLFAERAAGVKGGFDDDHFRECFDSMRNAFRKAANGGAVKFC